MVEKWEVEKARDKDTNTLKNWIWLAVSANQPVPGNISVEALRHVLRERGEVGCGFHNT